MRDSNDVVDSSPKTESVAYSSTMRHARHAGTNVRNLSYSNISIPARIARVSVNSCLKVEMQADLEHRDERPSQLLERVSRKRDERLKQLPQSAKRPANPFVFKGTERRVSPFAVGGASACRVRGRPATGHSAGNGTSSGGWNDLIGGSDAAATRMLDAFLIRQVAKCGLHSQGGNDHAVADLLLG